ncbi:MAG TPA: septum formation initiator family protein [Agromyces sp.]|nr:septum formation initiator family protein [Agromyces sp.]
MSKASAASKPSTASKQARAPRQPRGRLPIAAVAAGWLGGIRFSGFSIIMMGVLVLAVVALAPSIAAYAAQRQQIAEIRAAVSAQEAEVQRLQDERERWNDETFIVTQARERLYYVMPGEVSYLVIDDRSAVEKADAATGVSAEVTESKGDWMRTLLRSVMTAGLAPAPSDVPAATDAPATEGAQ